MEDLKETRRAQRALHLAPQVPELLGTSGPGVQGVWIWGHQPLLPSVLETGLSRQADRYPVELKTLRSYKQASEDGDEKT